MASYLNFFISVVTMPAPLEKRITEVERQFLYFLATLGRLYLFIILVILIGYSVTDSTIQIDSLLWLSCPA